MKQQPYVVLAAYRTELEPLVVGTLEPVQPAKKLKDAALIEADIAKRTKERDAKLRTSAYASRIAEVKVVTNPADKKATAALAFGRGSELPPAAAFLRYLWHEMEKAETEGRTFRLVAWDPKALLKISGAELGRPDTNIFVPYGVWGAHNDYWDMANLVTAEAPAGYHLGHVIDLHTRIAAASSQGDVLEFLSAYGEWESGADCDRDLALLTYFANRIGLTHYEAR